MDARVVAAVVAQRFAARQTEVELVLDSNVQVPGSHGSRDAIRRLRSRGDEPVDPLSERIGSSHQRRQPVRCYHLAPVTTPSSLLPADTVGQRRLPPMSWPHGRPFTRKVTLMPLRGFERCSLDVARDHREQTVTRLARAQTGAHLQDLVADLAERCDATAAVTLVFDHAVLVAAAHGTGGWLEHPRAMPAAWTPCSRVAHYDLPLLIDDLHSEPGDILRTATVFPTLRSYAGIPVHADGHVAAAVCVLADRPSAFTHNTLATLTRAVAPVQRLLGIDGTPPT